jgi:hypothetical protein
MIKVNNAIKEYILDLNQSFDDEYILNVESFDGDMFLSWSVSFANGGGISYYTDYRNRLTIKINNLETFKNEALVTLKNSKKDSILIKILPNQEAIKEKVYTFKLGKVTTESETIKINVVSKVNGKNHPWSVEYDGKPYNLNVSYTKTKLNIVSEEESGFEFKFLIIIIQEKSKNKLTIALKHNSNGTIEIIKTD